MNSSLPISSWFSLMLIILVLSACGGGGGGGGGSGISYTGLTSAAAVTAGNADDLATSSTESAAYVVNDDVASTYIPLAVSIDKRAPFPVIEAVMDRAKTIIDNAGLIENIPVGATASYSYTELNSQAGGNHFCGGSVTISGSDASGTITFNNLCMNDISGLLEASTMTINGQINWTETSTTQTFTSSISVTAGSETYTFNGETSCTGASFTNCTFSSLYRGADGSVYKIADFTAVNAGSAWNVTARFYHPDYGYVDISGSGLVFDCGNNIPSAGTLTITGSAGTSVSVNFIDCDTWSGSYVSDMGSGSIGGSWTP